MDLVVTKERRQPAGSPFPNRVAAHGETGGVVAADVLVAPVASIEGVAKPVGGDGVSHVLSTRRSAREGGAGGSPALRRTDESVFTYWADAVVRSYSILFFSNSRVVGLVMLLATMVWPRVGLTGLLATIVGVALAKRLHLATDGIRNGLYTYCSLLLGVHGAALLDPSLMSYALTLAAAALAVVATASVQTIFARTLSLPVLTVPFLLIVYVLLGAAPSIGVPFAELPADSTPFIVQLPEVVVTFFQALGAILCLPYTLAGLGLALALLVFSRIGFALAVAGYAVGAAILTQVPDASHNFALTVGVNAIFVAYALGGIYYVSGVSSSILAIVAAGLGTLIAIGLAPFTTNIGLPVLIVPFNLVALGTLAAMAQRTRDHAPKYVDFLAGSPEANLAYYRARLARFGKATSFPLALPVHGEWVVTQAIDGEHTHKGAWRHAYDFEISGRDGKPYRNAGARPQDFLCYRMPVLAPAAGTVVAIVDGVPDNPIGEMNVRENWGNAIVIHHAPGVYSLLAHLAPGSLQVKEGQSVRQGDRVALCGNSGRSARPHLHFHLQSSARVGGTTIESSFCDVIEVDGDAKAERVHRTLAPIKDMRVRNLQPGRNLGQLMRAALYETIAFDRVDADGRPLGRETIRGAVDLYGQYRFESDRNAALDFDIDDRFFTSFHATGPRDSVLVALRLALSRVALEESTALTWTDHVPWWRHVPMSKRIATEVLPFARRTAKLTFTLEREGTAWVVVGKSTGTNKARAIETRAVFRDATGLESVRVRIDTITHNFVRVEV